MKKYEMKYNFDKFDVVNYWKDVIDWERTNVDLLSANEHCWRCGCKSGLQFCHIKAHSLGGEMSPSNVVLLCKTCHEENPNTDDVDVMLNWLYSARKTNLFGLHGHYWIFRGFEECKKLYSFDIIEYLIKNNNIIDFNTIKDLISFYMKKASIHWGHARFNPATLGTILYNSFSSKIYIQTLNNKLECLSSGVNIPSTTFIMAEIKDVLLDLLNYIAAQERLYIRQKQTDGIKLAKERGKRIGKPPIQYPDNWAEVHTIWKSGEITAREAMRRLGLKSTSFYKLAKKYISNNEIIPSSTPNKN